jgi:hypothetical protein
MVSGSPKNGSESLEARMIFTGNNLLADRPVEMINSIVHNLDEWANNDAQDYVISGGVFKWTPELEDKDNGGQR